MDLNVLLATAGDVGVLLEMLKMVSVLGSLDRGVSADTGLSWSTLLPHCIFMGSAGPELARLIDSRSKVIKQCWARLILRCQVLSCSARPTGPTHRPWTEM